jgi:hypothetical protein
MLAAVAGITLLAVSMAGLGACERTSQTGGAATVAGGKADAREFAVHPIPLAGAMMETCGDRCAELSGLAWHGDTLILLPQYPGRFSSEADGCLLAIGKARIDAYLVQRSAAAVAPEPVRLIAVGLRARVEGFQGYEAIAITGDRIYLTIEATVAAPASGGGGRGYLVAGRIASDSSIIHLDVDSVTQLPSQTKLSNMAYEALVAVEDGVLAIHEANGQNVNPNPKAYLLDAALRRSDPVPFPTLEYRITDATSVDAKGRFWVMNYFWPGEEDVLGPGPDTLAETYGVGPSHARSRVVERLVELTWGGSSITRTGSAPIQLELLADEAARNWEGIARLDHRGFLAVTDRFPSTMLGFIAIESVNNPER